MHLKRYISSHTQQHKAKAEKEDVVIQQEPKSKETEHDIHPTSDSA